jgi:HSP20 family molecular chaperone IbpA
MAAQDWDLIVWRQANDLLQRAERIHRNFLNAAAATQYRVTHGRTPCWEPALNVVETDESLWVVSALAGVALDRIEVRIEGSDLVISGDRPLPGCCSEGQLKLWEIPLGRFERRLQLVGVENLKLPAQISCADGLLIIELRKQS